MCRDERVENGVIENTDARLVISQVVIGRLIVVEELHRSSTSDNTFWWLSDCHAVDFIQRTVKSLYSGESSDVPNAEHTRDIG